VLHQFSVRVLIKCCSGKLGGTRWNDTVTLCEILLLLLLLFFNGGEELDYCLLEYDTLQPGEFVTDISEVHAALFPRVEFHPTQHRKSEEHDLILGAMR
jgi:hypothetical protein